jgi:peptide/nickel transport system substrate-binding protein
VTEGGSGMLDPVAMGTAIQADLEAVGFDVTIETYEWNTFLGEVNPGLEGKADMAQMAWMTNDPTPCPIWRCAPRPGRKRAGSTRATTPTRGRQAAGRGPVRPTRPSARSSTSEMQEIVQEDAPWVFVANWKQNAVTATAVENFALEPSFFLLLDDVVKN